MREAEELATHIDTLNEGREQMRLIYRWAEVADGVAKLMVQAEEQLSAQELADLQRAVNEHNELRWSSYRRNIRWMNKPGGADAQ